MRSKLISLLTVVGAATVLVLAANTVALAATGKALIAGKTTSSSKVTSVKRTKPGAALKLITTSQATAPLAVNGRGRVTNLNADLVDGLDSTSLQSRPYVYRVPASPADSIHVYSFPGLPAGKYLATYSIHGTNSAAPAQNQCYFSFAGVTFQLYGAGPGATYAGGPSTVAAAGLMDTTVGTDLVCSVSAGTFTADTEVSQVTFTRLDAITARKATGSRIAAR